MLSYALQMASRHSSGGRVTVYAVACDKRGRVLAEAGNRYDTTHHLQAKYARSVGLPEKIHPHAEIMTIAKLGSLRKIDKVDTLYIARVAKDGTSLPARPCPVCAEAILAVGIPNVIHT